MPDSDPNFFDIAFAKKRLAEGLRSIVVGQKVILYVLALGVLFICIAYVFRWEALVNIGFLLVALWAVASIILSALGRVRLSSTCAFPKPFAFLPFSVRLYASFYLVIPTLFLLLIPFRPPGIILVSIFIVFLLYGIIPQFFISRWLAKAAEEGTMEAMQDSENEPRTSESGGSDDTC
jgi:hypothetical protein